jgi:hypothetical protein
MAAVSRIGKPEVDAAGIPVPCFSEGKSAPYFRDRHARGDQYLPLGASWIRRPKEYLPIFGKAGTFRRTGTCGGPGGVRLVTAMNCLPDVPCGTARTRIAVLYPIGAQALYRTEADDRAAPGRCDACFL